MFSKFAFLKQKENQLATCAEGNGECWVLIDDLHVLSLFISSSID